MGIFKIEEHLLVLDKEYIRGIPEFKIIIERDKGSKGDSDGRKKYYAYKEFYYIYMVADLYSYPNRGGESDKIVHQLAIKESGLEIDYKPDKVIKEAISKYREIQDIELPALKTLITVIRGLKTSDTISQNIISNINKAIELQQKINKEKEEKGEPIDYANEMLVTTQLVAQLGQLIKIANDIPKIMNTLETLEERLAKNESGESKGRGGRKIGNRADPT